MAYVKVENWVFELERWRCVLCLFTLLCTQFNFLPQFMNIFQFIVAIIFLTTNVFLYADLDFPQDNTSVVLNEERLRQLGASLQEIKILREKEKEIWEKEKEDIIREINQQRVKWEEEKQKLLKDVDEQNKEYTNEISYQRKLSKLEERCTKLEEQREYVVKDEDVEKLEDKCNKLEEEKDELLKVVEELKGYQQLWEAERNNLVFLLDTQVYVTQEYKELVNRQNDLMMKGIY